MWSGISKMAGGRPIPGISRLLYCGASTIIDQVPVTEMVTRFWPFSLSVGNKLLSLHQEKPAKGHKIAVLLLICYPLSEQSGLFVCISVSCRFLSRLLGITLTA